MVEHSHRNLMRERRLHEHSRVTFVELFFDLVFVFAVTQVSHAMLGHFTPLGLFQTLMLFLAVWWVWIGTSWITNWLDPERVPVRQLLFALMLGGLVLSTSIPKAFESRGLAFALAFVASQVGRTVFTIWAIPRDDHALRMNFIRILVWFCVSGVVWLAGGLFEGDTRVALWSAALVLEYTSALVGFRVPGLGASTSRDWQVEGGHMAERAALFIIIALGESIVVIGAKFAELSWNGLTVLAFAISFIGSLTMWWIYFHKGAEAGSAFISRADDPGRLARLSYTYLHMPIVAGIIVAAVGDELLLAHPEGHAEIKAIIGLVGGPLLFLFGTILFKHTIHGWYQLSHLVGIGLLVGLAPIGLLLSPLQLSAAATGIMLMVAIWEAISIGAKPTVISKELYRAKRMN